MEVDAELSKPIAPVAHSAATREKAMLWLDKYRPQRFIDLLSDERTNREVLTWIKKWDRYVFPDKKPMADIASPTGFKSRFSSGGSNGTTWKKSGSPHGKSGKGNQHGEDNEQPVDKRPFEKIILICGPPGAGKTTLANIIARHAGYNPIEINASDDRTAGVLKNKVSYRSRVKRRCLDGDALNSFALYLRHSYRSSAPWRCSRFGAAAVRTASCWMKSTAL